MNIPQHSYVQQTESGITKISHSKEVLVSAYIGLGRNVLDINILEAFFFYTNGFHLHFLQ